MNNGLRSPLQEGEAFFFHWGMEAADDTDVSIA